MSSNVGKIKLKNINELLIDDDSTSSSLLKNVMKNDDIATPLNKKFNYDRRSVTPSTSKKPKVKLKHNEDVASSTPGAWTVRTSKKEPPPNQMRIDTFFHSASKAYKHQNELGGMNSMKSYSGSLENKSNEDAESGKKTAQKRIFLSKEDLGENMEIAKTQSETSLEDFENGKNEVIPNKVQTATKRIESKETHIVKAIIDLCSDSESEFSPATTVSITPSLATTAKKIRDAKFKNNLPEESTPALWRNNLKSRINESNEIDANSDKTKKQSLKGYKRKISFNAIDDIALQTGSKVKMGTNISNKDELNVNKTGDLQILEEDSRDGVFDLSATGPNPPGKGNKTLLKSSIQTKKKGDTLLALKAKETEVPTTSGRKRKPKVIPPYKVIEGTSFAVDAFCYGYIEGVTHYFLSHYHADHYMGLTRKFAMPLYASAITVSFIEVFNPINDKYLHPLNLNQTYIVNDVEVTAVDANHCPGAVMFFFKLPNGKCILHTGDFRASFEMESEPIFWNNHINTMYLDTTYISDKYTFCPLYESLEKGVDIASRFKQKHSKKKILLVCGSYLIGKEKFWLKLVERFYIRKVWTDERRKNALIAIGNKDIVNLIQDDPMECNMHVLPLGKITYEFLKNYFKKFQPKFDMLLAFRPSGWEKNSKPQYRGAINIVGVEYSEHSSYHEMRRFVKFIKPDNVISTVPYGGYKSTKCPQVPVKWYKYDKLFGREKNFQTSISSYFKTPGKNSPTAIEPKRTTPTRLDIKSISESNIVEVTSPLKSTPMVLIGSCTSSLDGVIEDLNKNDEDIDLMEDETATIPDKKIEEIEDFIIQTVSEADDVVVIDSSDSDIVKSDYTLEVNLQVSANSPKKNSETASFPAPVIVPLNDYPADNDDDWLP